MKWLTAKGINADVIKISGDKVTIDKMGLQLKWLISCMKMTMGKSSQLFQEKFNCRSLFRTYHQRISKRTIL